MPRIYRRAVRRAAVFLAAALFVPACFVRHRVVPSPGKTENRPLLTATKEELIERIRRTFDPIQSFELRADMSPSIGQLNGGELTDYATIRAVVLFRRPNDIRVIGLDPVVHSKTIFDMVSTGGAFRVSIPSRNTFYIGNNNAPPSSKNKLENLRPAAFLTSLIVEPPDTGSQTILADNTDEKKAEYLLLILRMQGGELALSRTVIFDRYTLQIISQRTFGPAGMIVSETRYGDWKDEGGIHYPFTIEIRRPIDGYELAMQVISVKFNQPDIAPEQFTIEQPAGAKVVEIK